MEPNNTMRMGAEVLRSFASGHFRSVLGGGLGGQMNGGH